MNGKDIELTRRRVLGGVATIGAASAAAGAGTFAYFSDTESSTGNTVEAGTLDLSAPSDGVISLSGAVPGDSVSGTVSSTYNGSVNAEIDLDVSVGESSGELTETSSNNTELGATAFASYLEVTTATVDVGANSENLLTSGAITDDNGDGTITLDELISSAPFDTVTGSNAASGETVSLSLGLNFLTTAGNDAQADSVDITVEFTAQQPGKD